MSQQKRKWIKSCFSQNLTQYYEKDKAHYTEQTTYPRFLVRKKKSKHFLSNSQKLKAVDRKSDMEELKNKWKTTDVH